MPHIMNIDDPRQVWIKLRSLYQNSSMNRRLSLKSQLYSLKMTEKMTIEEHLRNVSSLTSQLANIGITIPNEELINRVLTSLPSSWDTFRQMVSSRERHLTFIKLESLLIQEDNIRSRNREYDNREEAAMLLQQESTLFTSSFNNRGSCTFHNHRGGARG
jgi:hypothetical protein